jgi:hypothetical protein
MSDLFYNGSAMFSHAIHNCNSSILTCGTRGLGRDSQRVDEGLRMVLSNVNQKEANGPSNIDGRCLDASDNLGESFIN